jgi:hypothetical protein
VSGEFSRPVYGMDRQAGAEAIIPTTVGYLNGDH